MVDYRILACTFVLLLVCHIHITLSGRIVAQPTLRINKRLIQKGYVPEKSALLVRMLSFAGWWRDGIKYTALIHEQVFLCLNSSTTASTRSVGLACLERYLLPAAYRRKGENKGVRRENSRCSSPIPVRSFFHNLQQHFSYGPVVSLVPHFYPLLRAISDEIWEFDRPEIS